MHTDSLSAKLFKEFDPELMTLSNAVATGDPNRSLYPWVLASGGRGPVAPSGFSYMVQI